MPTEKRTQKNQLKDDAFYSTKATPTTGNATRVETQTTIITKVENLFAHVVATCNITTSGIQRIDGYKVKNGDIVLLTNQTSSITNGLMKVNTAGAWTYTDDDIFAGLSCAIIYGKKYSGSVWVCQSPRKPMTQYGTQASYWTIYGECGEPSISSIWSKTRKLVSMMFEKIKALIDDTTYEIVCRLNTLSVSWPAANNACTTIPFTNIVFNPWEGTAGVGGFIVGKSGFYHVDVRFFNTVLITPPDQIWLGITSGATGALVQTDIDSCTIGTGLLQMQGSDIVYVNKGEFIGAHIRLANNGHGILFPTLAALNMDGYLSIHYCGSPKAASH